MLCLADAIYNFKWVKIIQISQNGCQLFFEMLLIDVMFYNGHSEQMVFSVLIQNKKNEYNYWQLATGG